MSWNLLLAALGNAGKGGGGLGGCGLRATTGFERHKDILGWTG